MEAPSRMFGIQATTMLSVGHKPALHKLCGRQEAVPPASVFDWELWVAGGNGGSGTLNSWSSSDGSVWIKVAVKDNETSRS